MLILLREPLSIKEIALKLNISYATTKRHTINLYGKLDVNQRWDAVARAEELSLLPSRLAARKAASISLPKTRSFYT